MTSTDGSGVSAVGSGGQVVVAIVNVAVISGGGAAVALHAVSLLILLVRQVGKCFHQRSNIAIVS